MLHERHEGCFITEFVKDETVMSERFTNLEKPFNQIPKYTPVLNRRTHLSEFSYCVSGYHVKNLNSSEQIHTVMTRFPTWHHLISIPLWRGIVDKIVRVHLCYVVSRIVQCRFPYHAVSYPKMQCRTRRCNVVPGDAMSYPEMQCRTRCCNVVPGDAMSYPEMQCRTWRCNVVPGVVMSYPEMQCRTRRCNVVPGDAMSYPVL